MEIELLKNLIAKNPEEKLNEIIPEAILNIPNNKKDTISFIFWFCYMVETELNDVLTNSWKKVIRESESETQEASIKIIKENVFKDSDKDIDNLEYFKDKIKLYIFAKGENSFSKFLWIVNGIRNDLSHNRVDSLKYKEKNLFLKETKAELLIDYFSLMKDNEFTLKGSFKNILQ